MLFVGSILLIFIIKQLSVQLLGFIDKSNEVVDYMLKPIEEDEDLSTKTAINTQINDGVEYNSFLEAYFRNLKDNMGENIKGSCGYVALGMLLSYYDTYLDDSIIPEKYDCVSQGTDSNMNSRKNSPGIYNDNILFGQLLSNKSYLNEMQIKANNESKPSLHAKLITIGASLGFYQYDDMFPCGTTLSNRNKILQAYLKEIKGLQVGIDYSVDFIISDSDSNAVEDFIKEHVKQSYPVLVGADNSNDKSSSHAFIAYHLENDDLYGNMGWTNSSKYSFYKISNKFNRYHSAMVLKFNFNHSHNNNYVVKNQDGTKTYCYCSHDTVTYKKTYHNFDFRYEKVDNNNHIAYCSCYDARTELHNYSEYKSKSQALHMHSCACKASKIEQHIWTAYNIAGDFNQYVQCIYCFYVRQLKEGEVIPIVRPDN